jgi:hypothetical protein
VPKLARGSLGLKSVAKPVVDRKDKGYRQRVVGVKGGCLVVDTDNTGHNHTRLKNCTSISISSKLPITI